MSSETLILTRSEVAQLLTIEECIDAVENAFKLYGEERVLPPKVLGMHVIDGGFHIKAGIMGLSRPYFVAKMNANFPANAERHGLPTIQGIIIVCDSSDGRLLALMDSIEITIIRTGAATAVAAKHLALPDADTATICGCGNQGRISVSALTKVRPIKKIFACDTNDERLKNFTNQLGNHLEVVPIDPANLSNAVKQSEICVTCTPSRIPFIKKNDIQPGTFIAAVGADSEEKQELCPDLLASAKVVVDLLEQASNIGELHHALSGGWILKENVYAELGEIVAGKKPGRVSREEITVFDSTGIALQDVAAAAIVFEKAVAGKMGVEIDFASRDDKLSEKNKKAAAALLGFFPFR